MKWYEEVKALFGGTDVYTYGGKKVGVSYPSLSGEGQDYYDSNGNYVGSSKDANDGWIVFPEDTDNGGTW